VSGIVGATKDNGEGVAGVAPDVRIVVAKVFKCNNAACDNPSASYSDVVAGVNKVLDMGAKVVNLSLGDPGAGGLGFLCDNTDFNSLLNGVWNAGAVAVFAAGNCGSGLLGGSSDFRSANALIVGATGPNDAVASYSNSLQDTKWGLVAPGGGNNSCATDSANCILSTWPRSLTKSSDSPYAWLRGTSMAAPHVTGALGAILARNPNRDAAVNALMASLDKISCGTGCQGRLNVARALGAGAASPGTCGAPSATTLKPTAGGSSRATATTRRPASATTAAAPGTVTTAGGSADSTTSSSVAPVSDEPVVTDKNLGVAQGSGPSRPSTSGGSGPIALLATLGILGTGATVAPLAWRRFLRTPR
jgi:serine protease